MKDEREQDRATNQILDSIGFACVDPADRSPQELIKEGWNARRRNSPAEAHVLFVAAAQSARKGCESTAFARALIALADNALYFYPGENIDTFAVRETLAEHAERLLRTIGDEQGVAEALRVRATVASQILSRELLEESLHICERIGDTKGVVDSLARLGVHFALVGDKAEAEKVKLRALEMARAQGDQECIAGILWSLAIGIEANYVECRALLEEAQSIYGQLGQKSSQAGCLILCARLACDDSDFDRSIGYVERALPIARELDDPFRYWICLGILIDAHRGLGDRSKAEVLEQERMTIPIEEPVFPEEMVEEFKQVNSASDKMSAIRKWFRGQGSKQ